ncbi:MAG: DNA topoisomerase I [Fervidicoccaceae archaeon]
MAKSEVSCEQLLGKEYVMIIAEKPKAAAALARALTGRPVECRERGVAYWIVKMKDRTYAIASTAGHMFTLSTNTAGFPVFDYEWVPRWEAERKAWHMRKFYSALSKLARNASLYINACDYDIEGSVIGYMIINKLGNGAEALRMKYSSLTEDELRKAFSSLSGMDWEMIEAGLCRHELDWIWGINLSRLLSWVAGERGKKSLSSGRVQSPTLFEVVNRYFEYLTFASPPKFVLRAVVIVNGEELSTTHVSSPFETRIEAEDRKKRIVRAKEGRVEKIKKERQLLPPPPAFNLSELQYEASRIYGFSPSYTQRLAEELYLDALISYPRTNSEKLPPTVPHRKIMSGLSSIKSYSEIASSIIAMGSFEPVQGKKEDPAHPAIYPTGKIPTKISRDGMRIYDLIARRYMAAFMPHADIEKGDVLIQIGEEKLLAQIRRVVKSGWLSAYYFARGREREMEVSEGDRVELKSAKISSLFQGKVRLYTKASLLKWMENEKIGTEATRAQIMETLFKRGYLMLKGKSVVPTKLGIAVALFLREEFPDITRTELTRRFEEKLLLIRENREKRENVVKEAKEFLKNELEKSIERGELLRKRMREFTAPENRCELCDLPALKEGGLCLVHYTALQRLTESFDAWEKAFGESREKILRRIARSASVGRAVREVARGIIEKKIIL